MEIVKSIIWVRTIDRDRKWFRTRTVRGLIIKIERQKSQPDICNARMLFHITYIHLYMSVYVGFMIWTVLFDYDEWWMDKWW